MGMDPSRDVLALQYYEIYSLLTRWARFLLINCNYSVFFGLHLARPGQSACLRHF
jgi:hypothetical protein